MFNMATARLRKTFHYPADNSDEDDTPRDLDEEGTELVGCLRGSTAKREQNRRNL